MNKTIEERAKEYSRGFLAMVSSCAEKSYITGAEEQKQIDIDKSCEWIRNNLINYFADVNLKISVLNRFRKAMGEL